MRGLQTGVLKTQGEGGSKKTSLSKRAARITDFDDKRKGWDVWAPRPRCHINGIYEGAEDLLEWAAAQNDEAKMEDLELHINREAREIREATYY